MDLKKVCRTCLLPSETLRSIFSTVQVPTLSSTTELLILDLLKFFTQLSVSPDDGLPDTICGDCLDKVRLSYEFKLKFEKYEFNWKQLNCDDGSMNEFLNCSSEFEHYTETRLELIKTENATDYEQYETISLPEIIEPETVKPNASIVQEVKEEPEIEIWMDESDFNGTDTDEKYIRSDLQCSLCTKTFADKSNLEDHMIIHSTDGPFQCEICSEGFRNKHNLQNHVQRIHPGGKSKNDEFKCTVCSKAYTSLSSLSRHKVTHTEKELHQREVFASKFQMKSSLVQGIQMAHFNETTNTTNFKCTICSKLYRSKYYLSTHMKIHTDEKLFQCDLCPEKFRLNERLQEHMELKHTDDEIANAGKFKCSICSEVYQSKYYLITHMIIHTEKKPFQSDPCPEKFQLNERLEEPKQLKRTDDGIANAGKFKCSICSKLYRHKISLDKHKKTHFEEKPLKCTVCSETLFKRTMQTKHTNIEVFKCDICSTVHHQKRIVKPRTETHFFWCKLCPNTFRLKSELKNHTKKAHPAPIREFKCATCLKLFGSQEILNLHVVWHIRMNVLETKRRTEANLRQN